MPFSLQCENPKRKTLFLILSEAFVMLQYQVIYREHPIKKKKKKTSDREHMRVSSSMYSIFYAVSIKNKNFQLVDAKFNLFSSFTRLDDGGIYHVFHIIQTQESLNLCLA